MIAYLIQMIACSGILYAYYHFFLRNERFHQYNRFYLLFAMLLSLILPLLKITVIVEDTNANPIYAFASTGETVVVTAGATPFDYVPILYMIYGSIALWMFFRLLKAISQIVRIRKAAYTQIIEDIHLIRTPHPDAPFSFFKWLFWNERTELESKEGSHMLKHELYHIRSKHSWDLLFMEIILSICWFNPFFYLYRKEVKTIQEFLADQHAAKDSDISSYAEILLLRAIGATNQKLITPFFHNQLKRRITMLTSSKKPQYQWLRKLLVLPVATVAIALFAFTYERKLNDIVAAIPSLPDVQATKETSLPLLNEGRDIVKRQAFAAKDTVPAKATKKELQTVSILYDTGEGRYRKLNPVTVVGYSNADPERRILKDGEIKVDVDAKFSGNWSHFLERNLNGQVPTDKGAPAGIYEVLVRFIVNEDGTLSHIEPLTNEGYGMEDEVVRILKKSPEWHPALNNKNGGTKAVKSYRIQPINFQVVRKGANKAENSPKNIGILIPPSSSHYSSGEAEVFTKVEIDAKYPGDWRTFLVRNLDVQVPVDNKAKPGTYTTIVQFIVDKEGLVSDVKPLTSVGYGMEQEAIRVIRKSGKWSPAIQNGREVKAYRKQPITFQINEVPASKKNS